MDPAHCRIVGATCLACAVLPAATADPLLSRGAFAAPAGHVQRDSGFATALAGIGRLNADARDELLIGQPGRTVATAAQAGLAWVRGGGWGTELVQIQYAGAAAGARLGSAVAGAGDVNGDGTRDFLAGAPGANRVLLVYGRAFVPGTVTLGDRVLSVWWASAADRYGAALGGGGDLNGDGLADFAIGAPGSQPLIGQVDAGRVEVRFGFRDADRNGIPDSGFEQTVTLQEPITAAGARFGHQVCMPGDMDGDGLSELAVAVPNAGASGAGELYVYRGTTFPAGLGGSYFWIINPRPVAGSAFAESLGPAGDVNGDGLADLVVGDPGLGRIDVYPGRRDGFNFVGTELAAPYGGGAGGFGQAVAGIGDVDGDGYDEVAVGDPVARIVTVFFGAASGSQAAGAWQLAGGTDEGFGRSLAGGDWEGSGRHGVVVGAPDSSIGGASPGAGRYHAWSPIPAIALSIGFAGASPEISWAGEANVRYRLLAAPAPAGSWTVQGEYTIPQGTGVIRVPLAAVAGARFYQVDAR